MFRNAMLLATVILIFALASPVQAGDWVYRDGYWWAGTQAYSVTKDRYGCWVYTKVQTLPAATDPDWRSKLTQIIANKAAWEEKAKASAAEHAEWMEAMRAVGYSPAKQVSAYSERIVYPASRGSVYGTIETQNYYNPTNLDVQWNQADRHVDKAQDLANSAVQGFRETLREASVQESTAKERVAAIYAKAALLKAADTPELTTRRVVIGTTEGSANVTIPDPKPRPADADDDALTKLIEAKCVKCHNAQNPSGKIDMTKFFSFDEATRDKVRTAVTNPDPDKRMPLKKNGDMYVAGEALSFDELVLFR